METSPLRTELEELRGRLRSMRRYIARLNSKALDDADTLLSVAESEVERVISSSGPEKPES